MRPVIRVVKNKIQYFPVASLIFTDNTDSNSLVSSKDLYEIKNRFKSIIQYFETYDKNYNSSGIKDKTALPYTSKTHVSRINEHLILHFSCSYKNPIFYIHDVKNNVVRNYIDIESAKAILDNELFADMKQDLMYPRILDRMYKGINEINTFISMYEEMLKDYVNDNEVSGMDCIEIEFED